MWYDIGMVRNNYDKVWGGELIYYFSNPNINCLDEFQMLEMDMYYPDRELAHSELKVMYAGINNLSHSIIYLFNEFVVQCFPSDTMSFGSFSIFCDKLGWTISAECRRRIFR